MSTSAASFEQECVRGIAVLRFTRQRLYDSDKIEEFSTALLDFSDTLTTDKVVVNLSGIEYFSSAGIGALIRFSKRLAQKHVQLRLCELQPMVEEIMFLQRLQLVFDIIPDETAALQSFE